MGVPVGSRAAFEPLDSVSSLGCLLLGHLRAAVVSWRGPPEEPPMATQPDVRAAAGSQVPLIPLLETGDCLSRAEFERRYEAMSWLKKAELVEGVVFVPSPVSKSHAQSHFR